MTAPVPDAVVHAARSSDLRVLALAFTCACGPGRGASVTDSTSSPSTDESGAQPSTSTGVTVPTTGMGTTGATETTGMGATGEQMGNDPSCGDGVPVSGVYCFMKEPLALDALSHPMLVADFNGDGHMDLATRLGGSQIAISIGDGVGGLAQFATFMVPPEGFSWRPLAGEFDGMPGTDIVVVGSLPEMETVGMTVVMANVGGAGDEWVPLTPSIVPIDFGDVTPGAVTDLDGDGAGDLLGTSCCAAIAIQPLGNDGAGTFTAAATPLLQADYDPCLVLDLQPVPAVGEVRAGHVAYGSSCNDDSPTGFPLYVIRPDGNGGILYFEGPATGEVPRALAVGDFDADGLADLVFWNLGDRAFAIYRGDLAGSFKPTALLPEAEVCPTCPCLPCSGGSLSRLFAPELDGDGHADIVISDGVTWIGMRVAGESIWGWLTSKPLLAADFNEDGLTDFIAREPDNTFVLLRSDP